MTDCRRRVGSTSNNIYGRTVMMMVRGIVFSVPSSPVSALVSGWLTDSVRNRINDFVLMTMRLMMWMNAGGFRMNR